MTDCPEGGASPGTILFFSMIGNAQGNATPERPGVHSPRIAGNSPSKDAVPGAVFLFFPEE
jgi:hypothetical protein